TQTRWTRKRPSGAPRAPEKDGVPPGGTGLRTRTVGEPPLLSRMEGGNHHVPAVGRAEGQAALLWAGGAGQDVLEVGGGAPVPHVEDVRHPLAASGSREHRLAAGEDGRYDQLGGGDRSGRARAGGGSVAVRYHGLIERSERGNMSIVRDRPLHVGETARRRRPRDPEARWRGGGILPVVEGNVARSAPRRRDRARPTAIDVVEDLHLARSAELTEPP